MEDAAAEVAGTELRGFFDHALRSTAELDYAGGLAAAGLALVPAHAPAPLPPARRRRAGTGRRRLRRAVRVPNESRTGLTLRGDGGRVVVVNVLAGIRRVARGGERRATSWWRWTASASPAPDWLNARLMEHAPGAQRACSPSFAATSC